MKNIILATGAFMISVSVFASESAQTPSSATAQEQPKPAVSLPAGNSTNDQVIVGHPDPIYP